MLPNLGRLFFILLIIFACTKDKESDILPVIFTGEVVTINDEGTEFTGNFKNINPSLVVEYGFQWGELHSNSIIKKHSLPLPLNQEINSYINYSLQDSVTYFVQAYASYSNSSFFGNRVIFQSSGSKKHIIKEINPTTVRFGDTVRIKTRYTGVDTSILQVYLNNEYVSIENINDSVITILLPYFTNTNTFFDDGKISLTVKKHGITVTEHNAFTVLAPKIKMLDPKIGMAEDTLHIEGLGFHPKLTRVKFGDLVLKTISISNNDISVLLPPFFMDHTNKIMTVIGRNDNSSEFSLNSNKVDFQVNAPVIKKITDEPVFTYDEILLEGKSLSNPNINFEINNQPAKLISMFDDSLRIEVPVNLCGNILPIDMIFNVSNERKTIGYIKLKQPENFEIYYENDNKYFSKYIFIKADYFPVLDGKSLSMDFFHNGMRTTGCFEYLNSDNYNLCFYIQPGINLTDGWVHFQGDLCDGSSIQIDSIYKIPKPEIINVPDKVITEQQFEIIGNYFNSEASTTTINIGDYEISQYRSNSPEVLKLSLPVEMKSGTYPLSVTINGQKSNTVNIVIENKWKKITDIPYSIGLNPLVFYNNDVFYIGGGEYNDSKEFHAYKIKTSSWGLKKELPLNMGMAVNDSVYGYIFFKGQLHRYDFINDLWVRLPNRPNNIYPRTAISSRPSGFIYDNKVFVFSEPIFKNHYYFDFIANEWSSFGGSESLYGYTTIGVAQNGIAAFIFQLKDAFIFNIELQRYTKIESIDGKEGDESLQGFVHNNEAYFYNWSHWEVYDLISFDKRIIRGPHIGRLARIFKDGNVAYIVNPNEIWKFNLNSE